MEQLQVQVIVGVVMSYVLEFLKRMPWFPLLTEQSTKVVKQFFSILVAAGSALAITFSFDPMLGRLIVDGLTWGNITHGLMAFLWSLVAQHATHTLLITPVKAKEG